MARRRKAINARALLDEASPEADLQRNVLLYAGLLGYVANHNYDSRRSGPDAGFPDLVLAGHGRLIFAELKREGGRASIAQLRWKDELEAAGIEVYVWRPSDWSSGRIEAILRRGVFDERVA
jgi:hypothetical protein